MKNKKWWIIGGLIVAGAGVGAYFLFRPNKEERIKKKLAKENDATDDEDSSSLGETAPKDNVNESQVSKPSYNSRPREVYPETPFKDATEGNAFRKWVNDNYSDYAKNMGNGWKLDPTGKYNNAYIRKAYQKYGTEYAKSLTEQEKKDAGVLTIDMTKAFQDAMIKWNKPSSITTSKVPYFVLHFRPLYSENNSHNKYVPSYIGEMKGACDGKLYIYNNFNNASPKDGKVAWAITWNGVTSAKGYGTPDLRDISQTYNKNADRKSMGFTGKASVGNSFGQIIGWDGNFESKIRLAWC